MAYRIGFVMEQSLGHIAHHHNLRRWVAEDPAVCPTWIPVPCWQDDRWSRMPFVGRNYSMHMSLRASGAVRAVRRGRGLDGLFYHTQTIALCSLGAMRRIPTVVSLDATPLNMDTVAVGYHHRPAKNDPADWLKFRWVRGAFRAAAALTTWNRWARDSLVTDYGIHPGKVRVIPPGVDLAAWRPGGGAHGARRPARLLFVGGDFERKGGSVLLRAFRDGLSGRCELDVVTNHEAVPGGEGVRVHRGLAPNSPELRALFRDSDLFVLPTLGDCTPLVLIEAMASGLAVVATDTGAIPELVLDGVTGVLIPPRDPNALAGAVLSLLDDPTRLRAFAAAGRSRAERLFCAERNSRALVDAVKQAVDEHRGSGGGSPSRARHSFQGCSP
jgi:glycosyltransferase involved in cell wall biosynthesis